MRLSLVALAALLAGACADVLNDDAVPKVIYNNKMRRNIDTSSPVSGCLYDGRWYASGATVTTRESCLRCACARSALSCSRRACAPLPDPPPKRCHVRHRRGSCCPELHCPDGIINMELEGSARSALDDFSNLAQGVFPACVEGGTIYAAGSAMSASVACEQCFCLKGAKKCVRPTCLPPPPHCVSRPTPGACCPQRYYCEHDRPVLENSYDCKVNGRRIQEGERVISDTNCTTCFCLKGAVRCQALECAPSLHGCEPIMRPGECCAHQYKCHHGVLKKGTLLSQTNADKINSVLFTRMDNRAFNLKNMSKLLEITTKKILDEIYTVKNVPVALATNNLITTTKVKRRTDENSLNSNENSINGTQSSNVITIQKDIAAAKLITSASTEMPTEETTEQPEGTLKIIINGTINCTAELSSTSIPLSIANDTDKKQMEVLPRIPIVNSIEAQTYSPNDIITDRSANGDFDENDTFTINVTSSLNAKTNSTPIPVITTASKIPPPVDLVNSLNSTKKTKGDYDYDYAEPTLPPSLPNLKIIPFVAADAVVDDEPPKETLTYPVLEREDKYPVYYPTDSKEASFNRREDVYHPTQYPIFMSEQEPIYSHDLSLLNNRYQVQSDLGHQYASLGNHKIEAKTKAPLSSSTFVLSTPAVNLFSPPVETEGGFIPKGPGIIDEYYAVYSSTPSSLPVPHLTTSMQLDISKDECISEDGQHIPDGESISLHCSQCICTWGRLSCAPTLCQAPIGCEFRSPTVDSEDQCCGDIVCLENVTKSILPITENKINDSAIDIKNTNGTIHASQTKETAMESHFTSLNGTNIFKNSNRIQENDIEKSSIKPASNIDEKTSILILSNGSISNITIIVNTTTANPLTNTKTPITTSTLNTKEVNYTSSEYDEDDDDEFSFGSVLKLLLSDSYDSSTKATNKEPVSTKATSKPQTLISTTTAEPATVNPFKPLPPLAFIPPQNSLPTVDRIDHLILGEATAIKRTTTRPITNKTTKRPTERPDADLAFTSAPRPPNLSGSSLPGIGAELLKLAGCNIYGRMYRVGRIITELSSACQECWCTEVGVQCKPLGC